MLTILATARVLAGHWPALVAWFLAGRLVHYVLIELAGYVGAWTSVGGLLLLPLAILARLVSYVAMFLVLRGGLRSLQAVAPVPESAAERRRTFVVTLLASILPFFAIYTAWGMLQEDIIAYTFRALQVRSGITLTAAVEGREVADAEIGSIVSFNAVTVAIIAVTFAGRWAWKRWQKQLPAPLVVVAVYFEGVWVCLAMVLIKDAVAGLSGWVDTRVGMQWVLQLRAWVSDQLAPIAWIWDGVEWLLGELGGLLTEPLAWLTVAGVIYGQAIAAERPKLDLRLFERAKTRIERVPSPLRRMLREFGDEIASRFRPIVNAIVLMWRAGPVTIATYVLLYTLVLAGSSSLAWLITRMLGPQDLDAFWSVVDEVLVLVVALLIEPVRVSLVAGAYDSALGALRAQRAEEDAAAAAQEPDAAAAAQGSIENRTNEGTASSGETSTQNGPSASSGTANATTSS